MRLRENELHVITGTSGTGKSVLLAALVECGYEGFAEPVRKTLEHQLEIDGPALPSKDADLFIRALLTQSLRDFGQAVGSKNISFFDRGLPDLIAYANRFGVESAEIVDAAKKSRYSEKVFVLSPWDEIFEPDEFRKASFAEYKNFHRLITDAYTDMGYSLVEVPKVSITSRVDFILSALNLDSHLTCS